MSTNENKQRIGIMLVDDDVGFQQRVAHAVGATSDLELRTMATTRAQGLQALAGPPADVVLVDLGLPDGSGLDVITEAYRAWPRCAIMVSTAFGDEMHVMRSLEAGASGYLLKDGGPDRIAEEIRILYQGGSPISPLIARQILTRFRVRDEVRLPVAPAPADGTRSSLSARERQVLEFMTKGFTSDEIAKLMAVSRHTVLTFVRRIYKKLEVTSKTEAIYEARQQGFMDD
jgi:DNA-binding NarL/FixJ family response regulator